MLALTQDPQNLPFNPFRPFLSRGLSQVQRPQSPAHVRLVFVSVRLCLERFRPDNVLHLGEAPLHLQRRKAHVGLVRSKEIMHLGQASFRQQNGKASVGANRLTTYPQGDPRKIVNIIAWLMAPLHHFEGIMSFQQCFCRPDGRLT